MSKKTPHNRIYDYDISKPYPTYTRSYEDWRKLSDKSKTESWSRYFRELKRKEEGNTNKQGIVTFNSNKSHNKLSGKAHHRYSGKYDYDNSIPVPSFRGNQEDWDSLATTVKSDKWIKFIKRYKSVEDYELQLSWKRHS